MPIPTSPQWTQAGPNRLHYYNPKSGATRTCHTAIAILHASNRYAERSELQHFVPSAERQQAANRYDEGHW